MARQHLNGRLQQVVRAGYPPLSHVSTTYAEPSRSHTTGDQIKLNELTATLGRRKAMIAGCACLGLLLGLALSILTPPTYRARTSIQLEGFNDQSFLRAIVLTSAPVSNESADNYLANEVKILESETLARRVADRLGIQPEEHPPASRPIESSSSRPGQGRTSIAIVSVSTQ